MSAEPTHSERNLFMAPDVAPPATIVVLAGGGIETAALLPHLLSAGYHVQPLHVRCGFRWEAEEAACLHRLAAACAASGTLMEIVEIELPLDRVLASHWGMDGHRVPRAGSPPAGLEIPLRNVTLLTAAAMHFRDAPELVLATGTTADNHFGDGSRAFFDSCGELLTMASGRRVTVVTPFIRLSKPQVIKGSDPGVLAWSWSCIDPQGGRHCGRCIKCGRRHEAFLEAGVPDPTDYVSSTRG